MADTDSVPIEEFEIYLTDLIEKEVLNKEETFDEILHKRCMQLRENLRLASPKKTGEYARGWRVKTVQRNHEKVRVLYNANKPELTFILEYGTSKQRARPHIRPALNQTIDDIMEELISRL